MTFFCPSCWREVNAGFDTCPSCGTNINRYSRSTPYVEKLISALQHPEPQTVRRAAWILGRLKAREAVPALLGTGERTRDPYVIESVIEALGEIGDERAREFLRRCTVQGAVRVRRAAEEALARLIAGGDEHAQ
ncbi:MAG: HEAT repeat domain-containing protein [Blastocatellia bacterium]|nr:HEAT repeat domain-containing protein [Blastocatellia bacterium]MCX7752259.1 HEAT repeat domain-containing protein [Blastocatellia bacterium]